jgi:hypothetical protein
MNNISNCQIFPLFFAYRCSSARIHSYVGAQMIRGIFGQSKKKPGKQQGIPFFFLPLHPKSVTDNENEETIRFADGHCARTVGVSTDGGSDLCALYAHGQELHCQHDRDGQQEHEHDADVMQLHWYAPPHGTAPVHGIHGEAPVAIGRGTGVPS